MTRPADTPRPLRADAARNRRALLDAAREAFQRAGTTASLDDIAKAAGVGPGTLYRHFPTRDDLVFAVIDDGLLALAELGECLLTAPNPTVALIDWLDAYISQASLFDGLARTLVRPEVGDDTNCTRSRRAGAALLARAAAVGVVRDDVSGEDLLDMATAIAWIGTQPDRADEQRTRLVRLLIDGLRVTS